MLGVGLTGGLGSGKSTVAAYLRDCGAAVIDADTLGRELMQPGQPVCVEIVQAFGAKSVQPDGQINRAYLAEQAFQHGRLQELNSIIHPAVIVKQRLWIENVFAHNPAAVAVVESALIFEVERDAKLRGEKESVLSDWRRRFQRIIVVTSPEEARIARYAARIAPVGSLAYDEAKAEAGRRIACQIPDAEKLLRADYSLQNDGNLEELRKQVDGLWQKLVAESNLFLQKMSLQ